ncbi:TetR family transcriptional regulator [Streptomyces sp. SID5785]|nr:TetR family transcriptional regulator [Streptomyces sp. SID5785]
MRAAADSGTDRTGEDAPRPAAARRRNRRGEGGRLREDIVDAAAALLDETGDERAITLRSVARRVGIAAPSIYPHFPDQPAIMLAVVRREFAALETHLRAAAQQAGDDPRARLYAVGRAYLGYAQEYPGRYRTMFGGLWMPTLGDSSLTEQELTSLGEGALKVLAGALADCAAAGSSAITDPELDAVTLWVCLHGLAHQYAATRVFPWPEAGIADAIVARVARLTDTD